jgi:hypothetical protein
MKCLRIVFVFLFIVTVINYNSMLEGGYDQSGSGILMKISGRVIHRETGLGIEGVNVHLDEMVTLEEFEAVTNKDGLFIIKRVPQGIYELNNWFINLSCPGELVLEKYPEPIKVTTGRNVIGLNIYLKKGASISGRVFKPDGVTPVTQGNVVVFPRLKGKKIENNIDSNGYYKVVGLGRTGVEELNYSVTVEAPEYADLAKSVKIKSSEEIKDFNFVIGKGQVHIKGSVTSSFDNHPIKGARISVLSVKRPNSLDEISNGNAVTDEAGNYSISGFKYPTNVDIAVFSDDYEMAKVIKYLKSGINVIDFTLTPKTKTLEPKERKEQAQLKCCDLEDLFKKIFADITCKKPNSTDENGNPCINNTSTLNCMVEKCANSLIDIVCREDCPKDPDGKVPAGYTKKYNFSGTRGRVVICINSKSTFFWAERMFHELYHICDREAPSDKEDEDSCAEARSYSAQICAFNNSQAQEQRRIYQKRCDEEKNKT